MRQRIVPVLQASESNLCQQEEVAQLFECVTHNVRTNITLNIKYFALSCLVLTYVQLSYMQHKNQP